MKQTLSLKRTFGIFVPLFLIWSVFSSFKYLPSIEVELANSPLELHGDSVELTFKLTFPSKMIAKKETVEIIPSIGNNVYQVMVFRGESTEGNAPIVYYKTGGVFMYSAKIKFEESMLQNPLIIKVMRSKGAKSKEEEIILSPGIITTPRLMVNDDIPIYVKSDNLSSDKTETTFIQFSPNQSTTISGEWEKPAFVELNKLLNDITDNDKYIINKIDIQCVCPFFSGISATDNLCDKKINEVLKKLGEPAVINKSVLKVRSTGEDMALFTSLIKESAPEDMDLILRILETIQDPAQREAEIVNVMGKEKLDQITSKMNRCIVTIEYENKVSPVETLSDQYLSNKNKMTADELLDLSNVVTTDQEKKEILTYGESKYNDDWRFKNNLACLCIVSNDNGSAYELLKQIRLNNQDIIEANYTIVLRRSGKSNEAQLSYPLLLNNISSATYNYNSGLLSLQQGDYSLAVNRLAGNNSTNLALSVLLNGDNNGALKILDQLENTALIHYLKAIALIRMDHRDGAIQEVTKAIELDVAYKEKAQYDAEFFTLMDSRSFMILFE